MDNCTERVCLSYGFSLTLRSRLATHGLDPQPLLVLMLKRSHGRLPAYLCSSLDIHRRIYQPYARLHVFGIQDNVFRSPPAFATLLACQIPSTRHLLAWNNTRLHENLKPPRPLSEACATYLPAGLGSPSVTVSLSFCIIRVLFGYIPP